MDADPGDHDPIGAPTLTDGLRAGAAMWPSATISFSGEGGDRSFSLAALHEAGRCVAAGLSALGLRQGDVLAMQLPNWPEAVMTYVAAAELGVTIAPIVHIYGAAEVGYILEASRAKAIVIAATWRGTDFLQRLSSQTRPKSLEQVIVVGAGAEVSPSDSVAWTSLLTADPSPLGDSPDPRDRALLLYTSGTTGRPKGVVHTQGSIAAEIAQMVRFNEMDGERGDDGVTLVSFPIGHMAGVLGAARAFYRSRHTIFMEAWDPSEAARLVEQNCVTSTAGTPFHMLSLFEAADREGRSIDSISSFLLGATTISPTLIEAADARGIAAFRCYGSTEQPTVSCGRPSDSFADRAFTDGRLLPGIEVRIVNDNDADVPADTPGEILSRGPDLMDGYTDSGDDALALTADRWYRSGDIGTLDARGFLTITDRLKDIIIRGGENIASKEVEDVLATHPGVREVAVVGVADERLGERLCAIVVCSTGPISVEDLRAHVAANGLARQKAAEFVVLVDDMPRTASGKIQKHVLREMIRTGALSLNAGDCGTPAAPRPSIRRLPPSATR